MKSGTFRRRLECGFLALCFLLALSLPAYASVPAEAALSPESESAEGPAPETTAVPTEEPVPETAVPTETAETLPPETEPVCLSEEEPVFTSPYALYFGLLHAHTDLSDGLGSVEEAFRHAAEVEGLDFFAVTDHSNSFDNADAGAITLDGSTVSAEWAAGKAAAATVTDETFLGLFGFEMTWPEIRQLGHMITLGTPGWISRDQEGFADDPDALPHYLEALSEVPGSVSQFCHPGSLYGDFEGFRNCQPAYDASVQLVEVLGEGSLSEYIQALDAGWHLAPTASQNNHNGNWGSENSLRTVVLAEALTEEQLFAAIHERRVYAAEDADLHIFYELDGSPMGSILSRADDPEIFLSLYDPTDPGSCTLEVVTEGGAVLARTEAEGNGDLIIPVPGGYRWYFLKITQEDGDTAVTAPVWVEGYENMGIAAFTADTPIPLQGQPVNLEITLFNDEAIPFRLSSVELYWEDTLLYTLDVPGTVPAGSRFTCSIPYTHPVCGTAQLRVLVRGSVPGQERSYESNLTLRFRPEETVTGLLIHGGAGTAGLTHLKDLAREAGMAVTVFTEEMPLGGELLLIPALSELPGEYFREDAALFLEEGGSLILTAGPDSAEFANSLLEALGASLRFPPGTVPEGSFAVFNTAAAWCEKLSENQFFRCGTGCPVDPGSGTWLAKADSGEVLLACEETPFGGWIFAAGNPFLLDAQMPRPQTRWEFPSANQTIFQTILGSDAEVLEMVSIREVRDGSPGETYRVKGFATSGTCNPRTAFPDTLYLQEESGGIAVTGFRVPDIQIGTPLEIIGILQLKNGVPELEYLDHRLSQEPYHHFSPETVGCKNVSDHTLHGGELVQIEGTVTALTLTADRKGISRLEVKDFRGDTAIVEIEDTILSGSTGRNTLAKTIRKDRTVRAIGLVHINEAGETVLRIRDCDEVVYVPPRADPTNPKTEDRRWHWLSSALG